MNERNPLTLTDDVTRITENIYAFSLPSDDYRAGRAYVLRTDEGLVLIDAVHSAIRAAVNNFIAQSGLPVRALLLTSGKLVDAAYAGLDDMSEWLNNAPVFLSEADLPFAIDGVEDPVDHLIVEDLGLRAIPFPGSTPGAVAYYCATSGALFLGEAGIGSPPDAETPTMVRPPDYLLHDGEGEDNLRDHWRRLDVAVEHLLPLRGTPVSGRERVDQALTDLRREQPTVDLV